MDWREERRERERNYKKKKRDTVTGIGGDNNRSH
jgi:hypothetical protein